MKKEFINRSTDFLFMIKGVLLTSLSIFCLLWNEFVNRYANWCFIFLIRYIQWTVSFGQNFDNASARNLVMHRPEFWLWPQNLEWIGLNFDNASARVLLKYIDQNFYNALARIFLKYIGQNFHNASARYCESGRIFIMHRVEYYQITILKAVVFKTF